MTKEVRKDLSHSDYERLCDEVWRHNRLYFQEMHPEISDAAYDALLVELEAIEKAHPEWISETSPTQRVGEKPISGFKDIEHQQPMLSLEKAFSENELFDFHKRVLKLLEVSEIAMTAELKLDGLAISVIYEKGHFVRAVTRGDGRVGSDVTQNLKTLKSLPLRLCGDAFSNLPDHLEVRGEVFLPQHAFEKMNEERKKQDLPLWANARNAAAGSLKLLDPKKVAERSELAVVFYGIASHVQNVPKSQHALYPFFHTIGLPTLLSCFKINFPVVATATSPQEVLDFAHNIANKRAELPFAIDGIVIKIDDLDAFDRLGTTGKHPRGAIAYKFSAEQAWTYLEAITVQVGRTGVITPVAELIPVSLAGSTICRATLHNFEEVERKDVRPGDYVCIEKGGDVIPKVVTVDKERRNLTSEPWKAPETCPSCSTSLVKDPHEVAWRCPNKQGCPDQVTRGLIHFASKAGLDIEHLGDKVMHQLVAKGFVKSFSDIFSLTKQMLLQLDGFKEKSAVNLLESIEKAKKTTLARFIMALGIRYVGKETAERIAERCTSMQAIFDMSVEDFLTCEGVGEKVAASLYEYLQSDSNRHEITSILAHGILFEEANRDFDITHPFYNKTLCLTGTLTTMARHIAIAKIKEVGGRTSDTVSKKVDILVAADQAGSKLEKAKKLAIPILNEEQFLQALSS